MGRLKRSEKNQQFRGILTDSDKEIVNVLLAREKGSRGAFNPFFQLSSTDYNPAKKILWPLLHLVILNFTKKH